MSQAVSGLPWPLRCSGLACTPLESRSRAVRRRFRATGLSLGGAGRRLCASSADGHLQGALLRVLSRRNLRKALGLHLLT